jgi:hypothetical protein
MEPASAQKEIRGAPPRRPLSQRVVSRQRALREREMSTEDAARNAHCKAHAEPRWNTDADIRSGCANSRGTEATTRAVAQRRELQQETQNKYAGQPLCVNHLPNRWSAVIALTDVRGWRS